MPRIKKGAPARGSVSISAARAYQLALATREMDGRGVIPGNQYAPADVKLVESLSKATDFAPSPLRQKLCECSVGQVVGPDHQLEVRPIPTPIRHD
jgi:hypothetical protein